MRWHRFGVLFLLVAVGVGCSASGPELAEGVVVTDGFEATVVASDFDGPTQMVFTPAGDIVIAELNGAENDATGRVVLIDQADWSTRTVLQESLDKPTGVAVVGDLLWIMERNRLSVTTLEPLAAMRVFADDLPSNGRSEGTLTVTDAGSLLFDTSGSKRGAERVAGSGTLFEIADAASETPGDPEPLATGFKHAYAHVFDAAGGLWTVEMTDGNFDEQRASDELVKVQAGDDGGWPFCVENNRPVSEFGGTAELCADSPVSHALFGFGATPTSLVVAPWDDVLLVALWLPGKVVTVPLTPAPGEPHVPTDFATGIESPQHLLVDGNRVLVSDHATGQIFALSPTS